MDTIVAEGFQCQDDEVEAAGSRGDAGIPRKHSS